eukprot:TRINITY_DN11865_c0_g1_i1.p1 TRINITY_DN11865_c0_g1~~TRINITY_DN11865_c0_g1_i1.p1  ORF type:complete len:108 (-),score=10.51 TRINITY_DN11865_c0_g1_i1:27-350(-)
MIRLPPISTLSSSSAASDVYKRQGVFVAHVGVRAAHHDVIPHTGLLLSGCTQLVDAFILLRLHKQRVVPQVHVLRVPNQLHLQHMSCLLYTSPSPRDRTRSRMPSSA